MEFILLINHAWNFFLVDELEKVRALVIKKNQ